MDDWEAFLAALATQGMVTDPVKLDIAYIHLTGCRTYLCGGCGKVTRHPEGRHKGHCRER